MTQQEHKKEQSRLIGAITRSKTNMRSAKGSLVQKIEMKKNILSMEENLRQHKLNIFSMVKD